MDKGLLKRTAFQSVALMIAVVTLSFALHQYNIVVISASDVHSIDSNSVNIEQSEESQTDSSSLEEESALQEDLPVEAYVPSEGLQGDVGGNINSVTGEVLSGFPGMLQEIDMNIAHQLGERFLVIKKLPGENVQITLEDLYMTKSIRVILSGLEDDGMDYSTVGRVNNMDYFIGEPQYIEIVNFETDPDDGAVTEVVSKDFGKDVVHSITINNMPNVGTGLYDTELMIEFDNVYAHILAEDEGYYYIGLKHPHEVYDKVLVIDAGHGGKDPGALSADDSVYEKNINIKLLLYVKELLDNEDIKVYYTRLGDDKVFLRPRVELANAVDCDFFISIHCNGNDVRNPRGTEILYYGTEFKNVNAQKLATIFSKQVEDTTTLPNSGLMRQNKEDIYILNHATVPAIIVEAGYMTHSSDLEYLIQEENQKAVALGIYKGIMKAYEEFNIIDRY
ncbi:MAG TPA: N-acetylmuramoyl-L-alanine amidase [Mobilitalea sp.]|nr:N-acetylmuramoyl-L-alanine amidase [Mobilitalea sp.]